MSSAYKEEVLKEINKFRANPKSLQHQCGVVRTGLSRLKPNDPFLNQIDDFVNELETQKPLPTLEFNEALSASAQKLLPSFRGNESFKKYRKRTELKGIVPDRYMDADPAMVAADGPDTPVNILTMILLDKNDIMKDGKNILMDPKLTQIGIGHEVYEGDDNIIILFASRYITDEPTYELPEGDLSELKKAFDILDTSGNQILDMDEVMEAMEEMKFDQTDPALFEIFDELADKKTCSWPKFAYFANKRMTTRSKPKGLDTIRELFIDNPNKSEIDSKTLKKLCDEIGYNLTEQEIRDILRVCAENHEEITPEEFNNYMYEEKAEEESPKKVEVVKTVTKVTVSTVKKVRK